MVSREVACAPEELFDVIARPMTWGEWFTVHREFVEMPPERLTEGATFVSRVAVLDANDEFVWKVDLLEEPYRMVLLGSGTGLRSEFTYWLRPSGAGTALTVGGVFNGPSMTVVLSQALERRGRDELVQALDRLIRLVTVSRQS